MRRFVICILLILSSSFVSAAEIMEKAANPPLFEAAVFAGYGYLPDYPASDQNHSHFLALPYLIYRGTVIRSDREGAHAQMLRSERLELEMSVGGSLPVSSSDNVARRGMPDLDYLGEIGPRLSWTIMDFSRHGRLALRLPVRAVFSSNLDNLHYRGFLVAPALTVVHYDFLKRDWLAFGQLIGNFGGHTLNAYFYDVNPQFASPNRPAYDARAGYMGTDLLVGMAIPFGHHFRLFNVVEGSFHQGSANAASPLFKQDTNFVWLTGISWFLFESKTRGVIDLK